MDAHGYEENIHLLVQGTCACGRALGLDNDLPEPAGTVSLAKLIETAHTAADLARCLCGAWHGRAGTAYACYRLAGGPYIAAVTDIAARPRQTEIQALNAPPGQPSSRPIHILTPAELEAAKLLGQPASIQAAWAEALFALQLGAEQVQFPAGAGMRCTATLNPSVPHTLDLSVIQLPDGGPQRWLSDHDFEQMRDGLVHLLIDHDADIVQRLAHREVQSRKLEAESRPQAAMRVSRRTGFFSVTLNTRVLPAQAAGHGVGLFGHIAYIVGTVQSRLSSLDNAASEMLMRLSAEHDGMPDSDSSVLHLRSSKRELDVDVADYAQASPARRHHLIETYREALAA